MKAVHRAWYTTSARLGVDILGHEQIHSEHLVFQLEQIVWNFDWKGSAIMLYSQYSNQRYIYIKGKGIQGLCKCQYVMPGIVKYSAFVFLVKFISIISILINIWTSGIQKKDFNTQITKGADFILAIYYYYCYSCCHTCLPFRNHSPTCWNLIDKTIKGNATKILTAAHDSI